MIWNENSTISMGRRGFFFLFISFHYTYSQKTLKKSSKKRENVTVDKTPNPTRLYLSEFSRTSAVTSSTPDSESRVSATEWRLVQSTQLRVRSWSDDKNHNGRKHNSHRPQNNPIRIKIRRGIWICQSLSVKNLRNWLLMRSTDLKKIWANSKF